MPTLATFFLLSIPLLAQTGVPPLPAGELADEIASAVQRLASNDFTIREQATEQLWRAGLTARPALEAAAKSDDREVALRARSVLERFRFGIFADTPPETLALIEKFRGGREDEKREALRELQNKKRWSTLVALIRAESNPETRCSFARSFYEGLRHGAHEEVAQCDFDRAEELLAWTAEFDESGGGLRDYAALLLARGKLAPTIVRLKEEGAYRHDHNDARLLARLMQVEGDLQEASTIAEFTDDDYLKADLYYRLEDWRALTKLIPGDRGVENLGFAATFHRLAGDAEASEQAVAELQALASQKPDEAWMCAEALMINGRWQEALDLLGPARQTGAFECLCSQLKFAKAFRLAGIDDPRGGAAKWFAQRASELDPASQEANAHFHFGLTVARTLKRLGERDEALRLLAESALHADDKYAGRSVILLQVEQELGLSEQARKRALNRLDMDGDRSSIMYRWFGREHSSTAAWWWKFFRHIAPEEDRAVTLARLERHMRPAQVRAPAADNVAELAERAERWSKDLPLGQRVSALGYIAESCAVQGNPKLARAYLEKQAELAGQIPVAEFDANPPRAAWPLQRIGDLYAQEKEWLGAAEAYGRAWQLQKERAASLYLQGFALDHAGQHDEGRRLMELAQLIPVANLERREELAETMQKLGHGEAALKQWELILRLGAFEGWEGSDDWAVQHACRALAEHLSDKDKLRAASLWQHYLHYMLKTNTGFSEASGYVELVHLIHRQRALGLLEAQRIDEAVQELAQAQAAMPGDIALVEAAIPLLVRAGRTAEADELFVQAYAAYDQVCLAFPHSAVHHNRLAWLAARCDKRLDDALEHAEKAVELDPAESTYIDTLAEVHFRRGDVERAISLEEKALELAPENEHFQEQLRRFGKRD